MYDVLVVGGGLAGATTALHLARVGREVVLLERSDSYRRKACGEGLFPRGVRELERLGLLDEVSDHSVPLAGVRFHSRTARATAPFGPDGAIGLGVQRTELDHRVLERARDAGVDVRTGATVRRLNVTGGTVTSVETDAGDIAARVVVAADGIGSRLRRQAGLDGSARSNRYGVSAHVLLDVDPDAFVDVYFQDRYEVYVTPVGGRTVNVAVLARRSQFAAIRGDLAGWFSQVLTTPTLPFGPTPDLIDQPRVAGPFGRACTRPWRRNLVLVGDAAGFLDAITGEGMSLALVSARDCAAAVDRFLADHDERWFRRYAASRRTLIRNPELLGRLSLALASRPPIARFAIRNMARRPQTFARLVGVSSGELALRSLRPADAAALLLGL